MDEGGEPKTDFARAVIERAMINGITPAQAAKELMEQRGEARMMAEQRQDYYIDIEDGEEIEVLRSDLFDKFKEKSAFGCVGHTSNFWYLCDYFGDSDYKIRAQIKIDGNEELINNIEKKLANETFTTARDFVRRIKAIVDGEGQYNNGDVDVAIVQSAADIGDLVSGEFGKRNISNPRTGHEQSARDNAEYDRESARISREIGMIILNAKKNGTLFKEPNGKDTKLSHVQWIMVRTKNFRNWFGDWYRLETLREKSKSGGLTAKEQAEFDELEKNVSKVVDENGAPLVVYHGSDFSNDSTKQGDWSNNALPYATYFSAKKYGDFKHYYAAFLNIRNPLASEIDLTEDAIQSEDFFKRNISDKGYDGAISNETPSLNAATAKEIVVTNPNQVKSATNNNGRYSTTDNRVEFMEGSDGTVYGWCEIERDAEGNVVARHIYLNDEELNANTMVHELGHLWLNLLSGVNPKLYEHGLSLAKQHPLFAELKASDEYGMLSDDEIADEVLARMIGDRFVRKQKNGTPSEFRFLLKVITNHFFNPKAGE